MTEMQSSLLLGMIGIFVTAIANIVIAIITNARMVKQGEQLRTVEQTSSANREALVQVKATGDLTHNIVNSQKTAMELVLSQQLALIDKQKEIINTQQQALHDVGSVVPAPTVTITPVIAETPKEAEQNP